MPVLEETLGDERDEQTSNATGGFLAILWQRKALVVLGSVLGLLGGALFYWQSTPVYQTTTQLWVIKKNSNPLSIAGGDPRLSYIEDYMATHRHVLLSPIVIERAVKKKDFASLKTFENCADPVALIRSSFTAARDTRETSDAANILVLSYRGPVADECGKILAGIVESFQDSLNMTYRNASDETVDFITKARDLLKKDLVESEQKYQAFRQESSLYWKTKEGTNLQLERVASIDASRSALVLRKIELLERVKFIEKALQEGGDAKTALEVINSAEDAKAAALLEKTMKDQLLPFLIREKELLATYQTEYPQVKLVRAHIKAIRDNFGLAGDIDSLTEGKSKLERHLEKLRAFLRQLESILQSQGEHLEKLKAEATDVKNKEDKENQLRQEVEQTRQLLQATIKQLTQISLVRDSGGIDARLLSNPGSGERIAPTVRNTLMLGLVLGMLAGVGLAYLADVTDKSFRSPDEVRRRLGLPLLGHVPFLKVDAKTMPPAAPGETIVEPLLCTLFRPRSVESEAFRAIRTALFFSTQDDGHKVLQISSPNKGDGKSLTASNLAISMAQSGKKVLLIDADCRRPRQHKNFNLANTSGLVTVIADGTPWKNVIHPTAMDGLWVMPAGPPPPNAAEMLSHRRFTDLLETARAEFDFVMVDTPPLLAVTDPSVVAGLVDGLVLVLRLTRQSRPHAERARAILLSLGVNILGVIVNGIVRQGGTGIYSSEHYDYSESYEDPSTWTQNENDEYYHEDSEDVKVLETKEPSSTN